MVLSSPSLRNLDFTDTGTFTDFYFSADRAHVDKLLRVLFLKSMSQRVGSDI